MERLTFQDQLRRSFLRYVGAILAVILLLYLGGFALNFSITVARANRENNARLSGDFAAQYDAYESGIQELSQLPQVRSLLSGGGQEDRLAVNRLLYGFANSQAFKSYFALLDRDLRPVSTNFNGSAQTVFAQSSFVRGAVSRLDKAPSGTLCFVCTAPLPGDQKCCYSFCRAVEGGDGSPAGYLFFNLREESFRDRTRAMSQKVLITDRYNNILFTTLDLGEDPMDKLPSGKYALDVEESAVLRLDNVFHYVRAQVVTRQDIHFYTLTSLELQVRTLQYSLILLGCLALVLLLIITLLTRDFTRRNSRELGELARAVEALDQGDMDYQLSLQSSQEFQDLYAEFRRITLRLRELMAHNSELLDRRRQMEVRHLEEQFNPHFVFNVIETVRYQISEDPESASEMLLSFARLMRYSVGRGPGKAPLETDVEYVNDYLLLQKIRYNNLLRYDFRIPDELLECLVPKLLLQPIVENCVKHGFLPGRTLEIVVEAERAGGDLCLTIRDNGAGIPPDRLAAVYESFSLELNDSFVPHIGLYNAQKILTLLYGPAYGLHIDSVPGQGTRVVAVMPLETEEESC